MSEKEFVLPRKYFSEENYNEVTLNIDIHDK